jgi:hypothetical protein
MNEDPVVEILTRAVAAIDNADVPTDLREAAFTAALRLLTEEQQPAGLQSEVSATSSTSTRTPPGGDGAGTGSNVLDKVAARLELDPKNVVKLFAEKDGVPELILKARDLPTTKSDAARDIALLVMAARQLGDVEEYTEGEVLRVTCKRFGRFDSANFANHIKRLDNFIITDGKGVTAKRKLTQPGIEAAAELAKKYLGED